MNCATNQTIRASGERLPNLRRWRHCDEGLAAAGVSGDGYASIPRVPRGAREGDGIAHVGEARRIGDRALEAEAEAGVRHRPVAPEVAVPGVVFLVDAALGHARIEHFETLLALAAADDLAAPRCEDVHRR